MVVESETAKQLKGPPGIAGYEEVSSSIKPLQPIERDGYKNMTPPLACLCQV